ncbi:MAG: hypothetical protein H6834_05440 [Planctomycetes bacterium]|nr:hypothetical protein [Planctomycetota bacterium]MCB9890842.1 hypothetical protein [Planctomycetota bacterium]
MRCHLVLLLALLSTGTTAAQVDEEFAARLEHALLQRPQRGGVYHRLLTLRREANELERWCEDLERRSREPGADPALVLVHGYVLEERGRDDEALERYEAYRTLVPRDPRSHVAQAMLERRRGHLDVAIMHLERAFALGLDDQEAMERTLDLTSWLAERGHLERALEHWTGFVEKRPNDRDRRRAFVRFLIDERQWEDAKRQIDVVIAGATSPREVVEGRLDRARVLESLGRAEEARAELRSMLDDLRPESWLFDRVLETLRESHLMGGDVAGYESFLRTRLEHDPGNVPLHLRLVDHLERRGALDDARDHLERLVERHGDVALQRRLIQLSLRSGAFERAEEIAEALAQDHPGDMEAWIRLGEIRATVPGQTDEERRVRALEAWEHLVHPDPDDVPPRVTVASLCEKHGFLVDAERYIQAARALRPEDEGLLEDLVRVWHAQGRCAEVLALLRERMSQRGDVGAVQDAVRLLRGHEHEDLALGFIAWGLGRETFERQDRLELVRTRFDLLQSLGRAVPASDFTLLIEHATDPRERSRLDRMRIGKLSIFEARRELDALPPGAERSLEERAREAWLSQRTKANDRATEVMQKALAVAGDSTWLLESAIDLYEVLECKEERNQAIRKLAQLDPSHPSGILDRQLREALASEDDEWIQVAIQQLVVHRPNDALVPGILARWHGDQGRLDEALDVLDASRARFPDDLELYATQVTFVREREGKDAAATIVERMLERANDPARRLEILARSLPVGGASGASLEPFVDLARGALQALDEANVPVAAVTSLLHRLRHDPRAYLRVVEVLPLDWTAAPMQSLEALRLAAFLDDPRVLLDACERLQRFLVGSFDRPHAERLAMAKEVCAALFQVREAEAPWILPHASMAHWVTRRLDLPDYRSRLLLCSPRACGRTRATPPSLVRHGAWCAQSRGPRVRGCAPPMPTFPGLSSTHGRSSMSPGRRSR